jgi:putative ABC transport system ATP-binding protein
MRKSFFVQLLRSLELKRQYYLYAILYGLLSLVTPLASQFLVNQLALAGLWVNTLIFIVLLAVFLIISQFLKFGLVLLNEYIQRELFVTQGERWIKPEAGESPYYFEVHSLMKSFSLAFTSLVDLLLLSFFGLFVVMAFHPLFMSIAAILGIAFYSLFFSWDEAIRTSVVESDEKYKIFYCKHDGQRLEESHFEDFLKARHKHFYFIARNKIIVLSTTVITQLITLGGGIYLIQLEELSIGQLVSTEIILSGILAAFVKFPKTLEHLYDLETSGVKLDYALKEDR